MSFKKRRKIREVDISIHDTARGTSFDVISAWSLRILSIFALLNALLVFNGAHVILVGIEAGGYFVSHLVVWQGFTSTKVEES